MSTRIDQANPAAIHPRTQTASPAVGVFGDHTITLAGQSPVRLDRIKGRSVPFQGFRTATQITKADRGIDENANKVMTALKRSDGTFHPRRLLDGLKTMQIHLERAYRLRKPGDRTDMDSFLMSRLSGLVAKRSNAAVAGMFQTMQSPEMALLREALEWEVRNNPGNRDAKAALANLFVLEAVVLKEASERIITAMDLVDDETGKDMGVESGHRPHVRETENSHRRDISPRAMKVLIETSAQAAAQGEKVHTAATADRLRDRNLQGMDPRMIGDVLRRSELTMNVDDDVLFGENGILTRGDQPKPNIYHLGRDAAALMRGADYIPFRDGVERNAFPEFSGSRTLANERPTYAALNVNRQIQGAASMYGKCVFVMRPQVAQRATYTVDDTFKIVPLRITPERIAILMEMLDNETPEGFTARSPGELSDPNSPYRMRVRKELDNFADGAEFDLKDIGALDDASSDVAVPRDFLVRAFGDSAAIRRRTATYDTLENLLPQMGDVDAAGLAAAARNRDKNPGIQGHYIEAQIQGAFIPSRDIAEIRINVDYFDNLSSPQKRAEHLAALRDFAVANGVRVSIFAFGDAIRPEKAAEFERLGFSVITSEVTERNVADARTAGAEAEAAAAARPSHRDIARDAQRMLDDPEEFQARLLSLAGNMPGFDALGDNPGPLLAGAALDGVKTQFMANIQEGLRNAVREDAGIPDRDAFIAGCLARAAGRQLGAKVKLLGEFGVLPFASDEQRALFRNWVISARALREPSEMAMLHAQAVAQAAMLKGVADAAAAGAGVKSAVEAFAERLREIDDAVTKWVHDAKPGEFGPDDTLTEINRCSFLGAALLAAGDPEAARRALDMLEGPEMRSVRTFCNGLHSTDASLHSPGSGLAPTFGDFLDFSAQALGDRLGAPTGGRPTTRLGLEHVPPRLRELLAGPFPDLVAELDAVHPYQAPRAYGAFPAAANPGSLPDTHEARRQFMVDMLGAYRAHEESFDGQVAVHGMGHASRVFIYSAVLANIMEEFGVDADRTALLCGAAGHDAGREGNGDDVWERQSADAVIGAMRAAYGEGNLGSAYEGGMMAMITDQGNRGETFETMLHKAADSLDIGRTKDFDPSKWPFLREPIVAPGGIVVGANERLRERLVAEVTKFQLLTNPLSAHRGRIHELMLGMMNSPDPEAVNAEIAAERAKVAAELADLRKMTNEEYFAHFEDVIRDPANGLTLLNQYYR
jgi:hypothetical protein